MHLRSRQQSRHRVPQRVEHDALLRDAPGPERAAVTRAAPVRIVASELDLAAARLAALPDRAWFDYPVTACLQHLPFTSVSSFARSLDGGGGHALVEHRQPSDCCGD